MLTKSIFIKNTSTIVSFDSSFIRKLNETKLSLEHYFILNTLNTKDFETFAEYNTINPIGKNIFQYLLREGFIQCKDKNYSVSSVELTSKALDMFKEDDASVDLWAEEWRNMWPKGVTSGGYPVRADMPSITKKMKGFIKKYGYNKEKIISVTKQYLIEKETQNWAYIKTAA